MDMSTEGERCTKDKPRISQSMVKNRELEKKQNQRIYREHVLDCTGIRPAMLKLKVQNAAPPCGPRLIKEKKKETLTSTMNYRADLVN